MSDFRRWFTVLAVLAVVACTASAQIGVPLGTNTASLLSCTAVGATPQLRPEGFADLAGDITISCTGGTLAAVGSVVDTTNIVVYLSPTVPITSRWMDSSGGSEILLLIDEPGSGAVTGATPNGTIGYGPLAKQSLCTVAQQLDHKGFNNGSSCTPVVGKDGSGNYLVSVVGNNPSLAQGTDPNTAAPNVYQGKVGDAGAHTVTFFNVPVLPPSTTGISRTFRITNIRVPSSPAYASGGLTFNLNATISTSPSQFLPLNGANVNIGFVGKPMTAAVTTPTAFQQCNPQSPPALSSTLVFSEGFATAFKTRVVPGGALAGTAGANTFLASMQTNTTQANGQNIPGGTYAGFAANSESGFIFPGLSNTSKGTTYTAGLADFGTRLKAVFNNIPAGLTLYVSQTSINGPGIPAVIGGTSQYPYAILVATANGNDANPDGSTAPTTLPITNTVTAGDGNAVIPLGQITSGAAVWEVVNASQGYDTLTFGVYVAYSPTSATTTNPYGTPITGLPLNTALPNATLMMAPESSDAVFANTSLQGLNLPIPRFAVPSTFTGTIINIGLCQTTLLYPYIVGAAGFDSAIAVANTSMDPFGTRNQTGSCSLWAYGVTVGASGNTPFAAGSSATVPGCDSIPNPLPGTNCFGGPVNNALNIPAGQVGYVNASAVLSGFQGYVIAVCNFQYAHGYAAITDLGLRNLWSSYLALELNGNGVGSPRKNIAGIENLVH